MSAPHSHPLSARFRTFRTCFLHTLDPPYLTLLHLVLLALCLLCVALPHPCAASRQQHNVWYSGLFISGIAVDEASGDVYFSDAAANRVVRQSQNGTVLHVYDRATYDFYSPTQLAYHNGTLYVADSTNNRVGLLAEPCCTLRELRGALRADADVG